MENKKEVVLDEKEAKELFEKLKEIFGEKNSYWPIWVEKYVEPYRTYPYWRWDNPVWDTSGGTVQIYNTDNTAEVPK